MKPKLVITKSVDSYMSNKPRLGWLTAPDDEGNYKVLKLTGCRDLLNGQMIYDHFCGQDEISKDKLRLAIVMTDRVIRKKLKEHIEGLNRGVSVVNMLGRINGWEACELEQVKCLNARFPYTWILTGPNQWIHSPFIFSMFIWMVRLNWSGYTVDSSSIEAMEESLKIIEEKYDDINAVESQADQTYYNRYIRKYVRTMIHNYNDEIKNFSEKSLWAHFEEMGSGKSGMKYLCTACAEEDLSPYRFSSYVNSFVVRFFKKHQAIKESLKKS